MDTRVRKKYLILNRVRDSASRPAQKAMKDEEFSLLSSIPEDEKLLKMDQDGRPIWDIQANSPAYQAVNQLMIELMLFGECPEAPKQEANQ